MKSSSQILLFDELEAVVGIAMYPGDGMELAVPLRSQTQASEEPAQDYKNRVLHTNLCHYHMNSQLRLYLVDPLKCC